MDTPRVDADHSFSVYDTNGRKSPPISYAELLQTVQAGFIAPTTTITDEFDGRTFMAAQHQGLAVIFAKLDKKRPASKTNTLPPTVIGTYSGIGAALVGLVIFWSFNTIHTSRPPVLPIRAVMYHSRKDVDRILGKPISDQISSDGDEMVDYIPNGYREVLAFFSGGMLYRVDVHFASSVRTSTEALALIGYDRPEGDPSTHFDNGKAISDWWNPALDGYIYQRLGAMGTDGPDGGFDEADAELAVSQPQQRPDGSFYPMAGQTFPADATHPDGATYGDDGKLLPKVPVLSGLPPALKNQMLQSYTTGIG